MNEQEKDVRADNGAAHENATGAKKVYQRPAWEVENAEPEAGMGCSKADDATCGGLPIQS